jgi:hypothetical protein
VNQSAPSGPTAICLGVVKTWVQADKGTAYSAVNTPSVVMRPILPASYAVNHRAPSGPAVNADGQARRGISRDRAGSRNPSDRTIPVAIREPQRTVRTHRDGSGETVGARQMKLAERAIGCDPADAVRARLWRPYTNAYVVRLL